MGKVNVDELLEELDAAQLYDWWLYYSIEPHAEVRADARHGILAAMMARWLGVKKPNPSDYIPEFGPKKEEKPQTMEEARNVAIKMTLMMGGTLHGEVK